MNCCVIFGCATEDTRCQKCDLVLCYEHEKMHVISCPYHDAHMRGSIEYDRKHGTNLSEILFAHLRELAANSE